MWQTLLPPNPLLLFNIVRGAVAMVSLGSRRPSQAGSGFSKCGLPGVNPPFIAMTQKAASITPESESG